MTCTPDSAWNDWWPLRTHATHILAPACEGPNPEDIINTITTCYEKYLDAVFPVTVLKRIVEGDPDGLMGEHWQKGKQGKGLLKEFDFRMWLINTGADPSCCNRTFFACLDQPGMPKSFARSRLSQVTIATVPATVRWFFERYDGAAQIQLAMEMIELKYGFYEDFDWDQFGLGITITGDSYEGYDLGSTVLGGSDRELGQFNASLDSDKDFRIVIYSDSDDDSHGN